MNDHPYRPYLRALAEGEILQAKLQQRAYLDSLQIASLKHDREQALKRIDELTLEVAHLKLVVDNRTDTIRELQSMRTWRYTAWLRWLDRQISRWRAQLFPESVPRPSADPPKPPQQDDLVDETARDYHSWVRRFDTPGAQQPQDAVDKHLPTDVPASALVSILTPAGAGSAYEQGGFIRQLHHLQQQTMQEWEWLLACSDEDESLGPLLLEASQRDPRIKPCPTKKDVSPAESFNLLCERAQGQWIMHVPWELELPPHALHCLFDAAKASKDCVLVYADEDQRDEMGHRCNPVFKPDFNPELLLTRDYFGQPVMATKRSVQAVGGLSPSAGTAAFHDLWLKLSGQHTPGCFVHLPRILAHDGRRSPDQESEPSIKPHRQSHAEVVQHHLDRHKVASLVSPDPSTGEGNRVYLKLPDQLPSVSIVIPTRDRVGLLAMCLTSLLDVTRYEPFRVVVVDNGSEREETRLFLDQMRDAGIVVLHDHQSFNFSRLVNQGVRAQDSEVVCLLNNDIEITDPDWLREMVSWAMQPGVAAVGARLWYGEGCIQHAGVTLGIQGVAGHEHKGLPRGEPSYQGRASQLRTVSAVTGACMVVRRQVFDELGGFDEQLPVAYNDIDFCLKAMASGYRNVYTPHAELIHHESITRGFEDSTAKRERLAKEADLVRSRWSALIDNDPAYNPNLTLDKEDCSLAFPPRTPWLTAK